MIAKSKHRGRGRPVGSGRDDSLALKKIAQILDTGKVQWVTSAIMIAGYHNPSDVRRLRDKFNAGKMR